MTGACCSSASAGAKVCDLAQDSRQKIAISCPLCNLLAKPVGVQTVKAQLAISLRLVTSVEYAFCLVSTCPIVYFARDGSHVFTVEQIRERVYQKDADAPDGFVCYCFRYPAEALRMGSKSDCEAIIADIIAGIQANQCACVLRNPQGSCCLGNVRALAALQSS